MTRETKIGLIVGGSFLCLVGIVVASKWRGTDVPSDPEEQAVQVAAVTPKDKVDSKDKDGAKTEKPPVVSPSAPPQTTPQKKDPASIELRPLNEIQFPSGTK